MKKIKIISYVLIFLVLLFIANKIINQLQYPKENQNNVINKKAIVVGATSGMGRAVAKLLAKNGYQVDKWSLH